MKKTTIINDRLKKAYFLYAGTEIVLIKEIMKLTGNRPLEIIAEGKNIKININLMPTPSINEMNGYINIEIIKHEE